MFKDVSRKDRRIKLMRLGDERDNVFEISRTGPSAIFYISNPTTGKDRKVR
jgi:hypothetical protein